MRREFLLSSPSRKTYFHMGQFQPVATFIEVLGEEEVTRGGQQARPRARRQRPRELSDEPCASS
jgi:hypothetical protein